MCQVENIDEMVCEDSFTLRAEKLIRRVLWKLGVVQFMRENKRRRTWKGFSGREPSRNLTHSSSQGLKEGDIVEVRSKEQVLQTLDGNNRLDGCVFMDAMWQYCGTRQKVLKRVQYFFDEANSEMRKARDTVLLEGLLCSGKIPNWKHECDRSCFYFWKEGWLVKIE